MGGGDTPEAPELSPEERALIGEQTGLLRDFANVVRREDQLGQTLLGPQLGAQGFVPIFGDTGPVGGTTSLAAPLAPVQAGPGPRSRVEALNQLSPEARAQLIGDPAARELFELSLGAQAAPAPTQTPGFQRPTTSQVPPVTGVVPDVERTAREQFLEPLLFEQLGITPTLFDPSTFRGEAIRGPEGERIGTEGRVFTGLGGREFRIGPQGGKRSLDEPVRLGDTIVDRSGIVRGPDGDIRQVLDPRTGVGLPPTPENIARAQSLQAGDILGFERTAQAGLDEAATISGGGTIAPTTAEGRQAAIQRGFDERTLAALSGNLPVSPALTRDLEQRRARLGEELIRDFGTLSDARRSSPGQERLDRFDRFEADILEQARRGALSQAEQLALTRQATTSSQRSQEFGSLQSFLQGGSGSLFNFPGPGQPASPGLNLGSAAQGFSSPLGTLAGQRSLQTQAAIAGSQQPSVFGTLAGGLVGGTAGFFASGGNPAGAFLGASAGSGAGGQLF